MKFLLLFLFLLTSCITKSNNMVDSFSSENLFEMTIEDYKKMLVNYNNNKDYPDIAK